MHRVGGRAVLRTANVRTDERQMQHQQRDEQTGKATGDHGEKVKRAVTIRGKGRRAVAPDLVSRPSGMRPVHRWTLAACVFAAPLHAQADRYVPDCPPARDWLRITTAARLASALAGNVTNLDTGRPIASAYVVLEPSGRFAVTDSLGAFRIAPVTGRFVIRVRAIGYDGYSDTITIGPNDGMHLHVPLMPQYPERCPTMRRVPSSR